jgi:hypothetical protein
MKIAIIVTDSQSAWHFRRCLIIALIQKGLDVHVITPPGRYVENLKRLGVKHVPIKVSRFFDPISDFMFFINLYRIFRKEKYSQFLDLLQV